jgi:hypothetical protein
MMIKKLTVTLTILFNYVEFKTSMIVANAKPNTKKGKLDTLASEVCNNQDFPAKK